ncbi:hypothetical protein HK096_003108 [Nowakowskiella sp. JEL0078]|nr:hypothetical protein HK096_003108 [Nowakowskiella sp. JEL0078]
MAAKSTTITTSLSSSTSPSFQTTITPTNLSSVSQTNPIIPENIIEYWPTFVTATIATVFVILLLLYIVKHILKKPVTSVIQQSGQTDSEALTAFGPMRIRSPVASITSTHWASSHSSSTSTYPTVCHIQPSLMFPESKALDEPTSSEDSESIEIRPACERDDSLYTYDGPVYSDRVETISSTARSVGSSAKSSKLYPDRNHHDISGTVYSVGSSVDEAYPGRVFRDKSVTVYSAESSARDDTEWAFRDFGDGHSESKFEGPVAVDSLRDQSSSLHTMTPCVMRAGRRSEDQRSVLSVSEEVSMMATSVRESQYSYAPSLVIGSAPQSPRYYY